MQKPPHGHMESFGLNCEPGFALQTIGNNASTLFRWAFAPIESVCALLENNFAGFYSFDSLVPRWDDQVQDLRYNVGMHSNLRSSRRDPGSAFQFLDPEERRLRIHRAELSAIKYQITQLCDRLATPGGVYIIRDHLGVTAETLDRLISAIQRLANGATFHILRVLPASDPSLVGESRVVRPHLCEGFVTSLAEFHEADKIDVDGWRALLGDVMTKLELNYDLQIAEDMQP